jgi:predicted ATP-dependent endonuclease of OLD family
MNSIGFKNFRRFENFKPIEYKGITFLVGKNNSGKSTLVKALLLIVDYLKSDRISTFSFNENNIEDANIVTFARALNRQAQAKNDDRIEISLNIEGVSISVILSGLPDATEANVIELSFSSVSVGNMFQFKIKPQEKTISISSASSSHSIDREDHQLTAEYLETSIKYITNQLKNTKAKLSDEYILLNSELNTLKERKKELKRSFEKQEGSGYFNLSTFYTTSTLAEIIDELMVEQSSLHDIQYRDIQNGIHPKSSFEMLHSFEMSKSKIEAEIKNILKIKENTENIYLGATLIKQSALFAIRDTKNALAQAIHEFVQLGIDKEPGTEPFRFVEKWMNADNFDVGEGFKINMYAGEAYEFLILNGNESIPLADKGMGSIQAMLLILRLATIIKKRGITNKNYTVIVEEPELNLHPALQSKLADLFLDTHLEYGIDFLIETHSEYILRKSQVEVAIREFEVAPNENPFVVHYFPTNIQENTYNLEYGEDGSFKNNFGSGFFDEAASSTLKLLKLKRQKKA